MYSSTKCDCMYMYVAINIYILKSRFLKPLKKRLKKRLKVFTETVKTFHQNGESFSPKRWICENGEKSGENIDENSGELFSVNFFTAFLPLYIESINEQMDTSMTLIERSSSCLSVVLLMYPLLIVFDDLRWFEQKQWKQQWKFSSLFSLFWKFTVLVKIFTVLVKTVNTVISKI